jgi:hypothetical protein
LKAHLQFWKDICSPLWILDTIRLRYVIPPSSVHIFINKSALTNANFVSEAISDLLKLGLVVEVFAPPSVINPLSVSVNRPLVLRGRVIASAHIGWQA